MYICAVSTGKEKQDQRKADPAANTDTAVPKHKLNTAIQDNTKLVLVCVTLTTQTKTSYYKMGKDEA